MIHKELTTEWTREYWEIDRRSRKTVGGSDAGAVLNLNKYASPLSLWAQKTGAVIPEDISDKEAVRLGVDLENYCASRFTEATGKKVRHDNAVWTNDDYPFAHANIDRKVVGEDALLECKTTSSWEILKQCREGEFPKSWYCQMLHYMMVTEYKKAYLAVLAFGYGFFWFEIERTEAIEAEISALAAAEKAFYEKVCNRIPPEPSGSEEDLKAIKAIFPSDDGSTVDLSPVSRALDIIKNTEAQIGELTEILDAAKAEVMSYMGNSSKGSYEGYSVSWKGQTRKTFDKKRYEKDKGAIPAEYYTESVTRPFKLTYKKG